MNTADAKIAAIAAADAAFVALFVPNTPPLPKTLVTSIFLGLYVVVILLFAASACVSFFAFYPQWKEKPDKGLLFWRSIIAESSAEKYEEELKKDIVSPQDVEDAYARENYRLCKNFARKNLGIQISIWLFAVGFLLALVSLVSKYLSLY
jgi:hypothetical protein